MSKKIKFETKCCICGCEVYGLGKNPDPVVKRKGAVCCDWCDTTVVIPARFEEMRKRG